MALAPLPLTPTSAISKAAAFNMMQSLRALLAGQGVTVYGVLLGPVDTDMTREIPKASPKSVAAGYWCWWCRNAVAGMLDRNRRLTVVCVLGVVSPKNPSNSEVVSPRPRIASSKRSTE